MLKFSWNYGLKISWLQKPFQMFPFTLFCHCCQLLTTPHEQLFIFQKMSASVDTVPTWLTNTKLLIIRHHVHVNKYELLVEGIEIPWTSIPAMLIYGSAVGEIIMSLWHLAHVSEGMNSLMSDRWEPDTIVYISIWWASSNHIIVFTAALKISIKNLSLYLHLNKKSQHITFLTN